MIATFKVSNTRAGLRARVADERLPVLSIEFADKDPLVAIDVVMDALAVYRAKLVSSMDRLAPPDEDEEDDDV